MSLESIIIKKSAHKYQDSNAESAEEIFTPNFITIRSSLGNMKNIDNGQCENILFYKKSNEEKAYDYCPSLISGYINNNVYETSENKQNEFYDCEFSDSIDCSEQMFSSNREDVEELKTEFVFPKAFTKSN